MQWRGKPIFTLRRLLLFTALCGLVFGYIAFLDRDRRFVHGLEVSWSVDPAYVHNHFMWDVDESISTPAYEGLSVWSGPPWPLSFRVRRLIVQPLHIVSPSTLGYEGVPDHSVLWPIVAESWRFRSLERCELDRFRIDEDGAALIAQLPPCPEFHMLRCRLSPEAWSNLKLPPGVRRFSFTPFGDPSWNGRSIERLTDERLARLLASVEGLTSLDCANSMLTDSYFEDEARFAKLASLQSLQLSFVWLGDAAAEKISTIESLEDVDLHLTLITDAALTSLQRLPQLKSLDVRGTYVTPAGVQRFHAAAPLVALKEDSAAYHGERPHPNAALWFDYYEDADPNAVWQWSNLPRRDFPRRP